MKFRNKRLLYAIVSVMVLFIMVVGSTVAYFALSNNDTTTITGNMADVGFEISVSKVTDVDDKVGLVPMSNNMIEQALIKNNICIDDNGNAVCQVYKISVNNTSKVSMFLDGYVTLTGGSGEPTDYPNYKYNQDKTTMRWAQAFCTDDEDGKPSSCSTGGNSTVKADSEIVLNSLGGESVKNDGLNRGEIKDNKLNVALNTEINGNYYYVINRNYIRVSDHQVDSSIYNQDNDITSALVYNQQLDSSSSQDYYFVVWLGENGQNQSKEDGTNFFHGKVTFISSDGNKITAKFGDNEGDTLYSTIQNNIVSDDTDIDFSKVSSDENGKGIYMMKDTSSDSYPIYYYRGDVQDNNVKFAKFCWKIVRTTETGGVKLIYNGSPDESGVCTNTTGDDTQLVEAKNFNSNYQSPAGVGYMYGKVYAIKFKTMSGDSTNYLYGNDVLYDNGNYNLETTKTGAWSELYNGGLNSNHYTCFSENNTCSTVNYIYYTNESTVYYIELTEGKKIEDALKEMTSESMNDHDSTIKEYIDSWYRNNMTEYTRFLEDTVWCNDRSISNLNSWNPDGGDTTKFLEFLPNNRIYAEKSPSLICSNNNDKFTVNESNGNGKLTYPVGLLTADEIMYAGAIYGPNNNSYYLYTGNLWYSLSPSYFNYGASLGFFVNSNGILHNNNVYYEGGVRPSISLRPGIRTTGGDGSTNEPFEILTD